MTTGPFLGALLAVMPALALAGEPAPPIPDTAAGHALGEWLAAFNSGDRARLESFELTHAPWLHLDSEMGLRERTGGYDLVRIDQSDKLWIVFRAREKASSAEITGRLIVRSYDPGHITLLSLAPTGSNTTGIALDEAERARVVDGAARLLEEFYLFPDVAKRVAAQLRARYKHGEYRRITDGEVLAIRLGDDLVALSGDKHVAVDYFARAMPPAEPATRPHPDPAKLAARNCSFAKAEHFAPNIGYLKLNAFEEPEHCTATAIAAMNSLADSDALIIDLRDNHGGAPRMAALICGYLFTEPTHLDDIYDSGQKTVEQVWTNPLPGKNFAGKPVFVLISARTFSVGEEFSYDLKSLRRATLIGETTGGGAHTVAPHRIDEHFFIRVPFGRFVNPVTKTDWEGTGVEPDVKVSASEALEVARKLAVDEISRTQAHPAARP